MTRLCSLVEARRELLSECLEDLEPHLLCARVAAAAVDERETMRWEGATRARGEPFGKAAAPLATQAVGCCSGEERHKRPSKRTPPRRIAEAAPLGTRRGRACRQ